MKKVRDRLDERYAINQRLSETLKRLYRDREAEAVANCHRTFRNYKPECGRDINVCIAGSSCFHRLCPFCNSIRTRRAIERLRYVLHAAMRPKLVTLTLSNVPNINTYYFRDVRSWLSRLRSSVGWKKRVRGGVYTLETTYNPEKKTWHVHVHMLVDADYIEQKWLSNQWSKINGGLGYVVDVRCCEKGDGSLKEVVKYIAKGSSFIDETIPTAEFLAAVKGARLLSSFGSFYAYDFSDLETPPPPTEKFPPCPCGNTDPSHWKYAGDVDLSQIKVEVLGDNGRSYFTLNTT